MLLAWYLVHRNRSGINHLTQLSDKEQNSFFFFNISQLELTNKVFLLGYLVSAFSIHILTALLFWKTSPQPSHWMLNELVCMFCVELFVGFLLLKCWRSVHCGSGGRETVDWFMEMHSAPMIFFRLFYQYQYWQQQWPLQHLLMDPTNNKYTPRKQQTWGDLIMSKNNANNVYLHVSLFCNSGE